jgi:hypothetical protein
MKHKKTITRELDVVDKVTCDRCGVEVPENIYYPFDATFKIERGESFPEYVDIEIIEADFCRDCAEEIIELLVNAGVTVDSRLIST